jgi:DNA ligase 1
VCICAFDLLYLNGKSLLKETFSKRREYLHGNFHEVNHNFMFAKFKNAESFDEIQEFLNESVKDSCEGLMVKTLDVNATYEPSKRSLNWLKLKKDYLDGGAFADSIDLVVVGADFGKGKRAGMFGSFLLACWDENLEQMQTVTKMGGGIGDELLLKIYNDLKDMVIDKPPSNLRFKEKNVDVWLLPKYVWEVRCADLSLSPIYCASIGSIESNKGIALRFPRFIRERDDKKIEDATSSEQILEYFKSQPAYLGKEGDDDEFDF